MNHKCDESLSDFPANRAVTEGKQQASGTSDAINKKGSTGPRTTAGKARSSMNALKYGEHVIHIFRDREEKKAREIRKGLKELIEPRNGMVKEVINELVLNRLRKQRVNRRFVNDFEEGVNEAFITQINQIKAELLEVPLRKEKIQNGARSDEFDRLSSMHCLEQLRILRGKVEAQGPDPAEDVPFIDFIYGSDKNLLVRRLIRLYERAKQLGSVSESLQPSEELTDLRNKILQTLEIEIEEYKELSEEKPGEDLRRMEAALRTLPPDSEWERYTKLSRALDREFDEGLERAERLNKAPGSREP